MPLAYENVMFLDALQCFLIGGQDVSLQSRSDSRVQTIQARRQFQRKVNFKLLSHRLPSKDLESKSMVIGQAGKKK